MSTSRVSFSLSRPHHFPISTHLKLSMTNLRQRSSKRPPRNVLILSETASYVSDGSLSTKTPASLTTSWQNATMGSSTLYTGCLGDPNIGCTASMIPTLSSSSMHLEQVVFWIFVLSEIVFSDAAPSEIAFTTAMYLPAGANSLPTRASASSFISA